MVVNQFTLLESKNPVVSAFRLSKRAFLFAGFCVLPRVVTLSEIRGDQLQSEISKERPFILT